MSIFEEVESIKIPIAIGIRAMIGGSVGGVLTGVTHHFTTCNKTGQLGPGQSDITAAYAGTPLEGLVTTHASYDGIQQWTVPETGVYLIEAMGAGGGMGYVVKTPGKGAYVSGEMELIEGDVLHIAVGQKGLTPTATSSYAGGGGGGLSLILNFTGSHVEPLAVGGGGGGTAVITNNGSNANIGAQGSAGVDSAYGFGGTNGNGGGNGTYTGGGTGYKSAGQDSIYGKGGKMYTTISCLMGGDPKNGFGAGGYGGGGGGYAGGGGGGGYGGGGGGGYSSGGGGGGGGGGSYTSALMSNIIGVSDIGTDDGFIKITQISGGGGGSVPSLIIPVRKSIKL